MDKLKATVKQGGYILIEDGFIRDESSREKIRHNRDVHLTEQQWMDLFSDADLDLLETASGFGEGDLNSVSGIGADNIFRITYIGSTAVLDLLAKP